MNREKFFGLVKVSGMFLAIMAVVSCAPGGGSTSRKKMPGFSSVSGFESPMPFEGRNASSKLSSGDFAFTTNNVDMMLDGNLHEFVSVALPNAANDSLAISLVNSFKPMALPLLTSWAARQKQGVVIDLSSHTQAAHRTDYTLEKPGDFLIPVVIIWDAASAARVGALKSMVAGVPSVSLSCTSGMDPVKN